jgi:hypothetical protein
MTPVASRHVASHMTFGKFLWGHYSPPKLSSPHTLFQEILEKFSKLGFRFERTLKVKRNNEKHTSKEYSCNQTKYENLSSENVTFLNFNLNLENHYY